MSRPAEAVHAVIKAYDVRGLVGDQIDDAFVRDVGGAFARLVRDEGATVDTVVIGHDMRASSPALSDAFVEGVIAQGLDVVRIGLASTDQAPVPASRAGCSVCTGTPADRISTVTVAASPAATPAVPSSVGVVSLVALASAGCETSMTGSCVSMVKV